MLRNISKNSAYLLLAQGLIKVISFFYSIFLAKSLGVEGFGLYVVALTYFSLLSSISDFGFNRFLIKEGAIDNLSVRKYIGASILIRATLVSVALAGLSLWFTFFDKDTYRVALSNLAILAVLPQAISFTFDSILASRQKFNLSALGLLILSITTTFMGVFLITRGYGPFGAIISLLIGQVIYAGFLLVLLGRDNFKFILSAKDNQVKEIIKGSVPFGILAILGMLYFKIDTLMLSYIRGSEETGLYGAAYRFLESIIFIPSAISAAMFPVLARMHQSNPWDLKKMYVKSIKFLGLMSIMVLAGFVIILPLIIRLYLEEFIPAIPVLYILSLTIPFMFIHASGVQIIMSTDKYIKQVFLLSLVTLAFNVTLNLIFLPKFGYIAAAWITVLSEAFSFVVFFALLRKKVFLR